MKKIRFFVFFQLFVITKNPDSGEKFRVKSQSKSFQSSPVWGRD